MNSSNDQWDSKCMISLFAYIMWVFVSEKDPLPDHWLSSVQRDKVISYSVVKSGCVYKLQCVFLTLHHNESGWVWQGHKNTRSPAGNQPGHRSELSFVVHFLVAQTPVWNRSEAPDRWDRYLRDAVHSSKLTVVVSVWKLLESGTEKQQTTELSSGHMSNILALDTWLRCDVHYRRPTG